ncbi:oligopeptide transport system ATP-binding protein [Paenibacillus sp. UNCCL117]|uniref:ABC transporter ATP-binding protein n=1 Tax=unclassified Paenibacillus TaxID=185978 RepID=UPI0008809415|nr:MULTISPECIES: oligopeptide/dipeptide ABC transporter ATP-binding protein [unclassified Paenibacillus]SDD06122.1 oligopeptide transport system ATP-binding protein [Paenibacillus sp. cl123]SFW31757.1 oligopeptide transport system ATP-binding protein [Paenibacillus sp. UNCCL117]
MTEKLLEVKHVKKYFPLSKSAFSKNRGFVKAVDDVSFDVYKGETFGLVGESGCGKSTLSRVIMRLTDADEGEMSFDGIDLLRLKGGALRKKRKDFQMVFQKPFESLNPRMTVGQIIGAPFDIHGVLAGAEKTKRVAELLELVGLSSQYVNRYPHEFSGGQRQRIGIARAIALNPKLVVCDEAVSALDVSIQSQILNLLDELQKELGLTYLFISHNLAVVKHMSDRIAVMYLGKIVEIADAEDLYAGALHPYTRALLSAIPLADPDAKKNRIVLTGDVPSPVNPPAGCRFCTRCQDAMPICSETAPEFIRVNERHAVACHLYADADGAAGSTAGKSDVQASAG